MRHLFILRHRGRGPAKAPLISHHSVPPQSAKSESARLKAVSVGLSCRSGWYLQTLEKRLDHYPEALAGYGSKRSYTLSVLLARAVPEGWFMSLSSHLPCPCIRPLPLPCSRAVHSASDPPEYNKSASLNGGGWRPTRGRSH